MYQAVIKYIIGLTALFILFLPNANAVDNSSEPPLSTPKYINVDVCIEYDWGDEENYLQVKVIDYTDRDEPCLIIVPEEGGHKEIRIFEGVKISIYDHETHKLLDVYEA